MEGGIASQNWTLGISITSYWILTTINIVIFKLKTKTMADKKQTSRWDEGGQWEAGRTYGLRSYWQRRCWRLGDTGVHISRVWPWSCTRHLSPRATTFFSPPLFAGKGDFCGGHSILFAQENILALVKQVLLKMHITFWPISNRKFHLEISQAFHSHWKTPPMLLVIVLKWTVILF